MATRGRIGMLLEDGSVLSVYSHWDNYPEYNGAILINNYTTKEKVAELLDGGDISSLKTNKNWGGKQMETARTLYYSERGDEGVEPVLSETKDDFHRLASDNWAEFSYLFDPSTSKWECYSYGDEQEVKIYEKQLTAV
jgi:hypothetical protein